MAHYKRKRPRTVGGHRYSSKALEYRLKLDAQDLRWLQSYPRWHDKLLHTRPARRQTKLLAIQFLTYTWDLEAWFREIGDPDNVDYKVRRNETSLTRASEQIALDQLSVAELLSLHARIGEDLRARGIARSANNPTGDLAEYLFCKAFGWEQAANSEHGFDATGVGGTRYQIKGPRIHRRNK